MDLGDLLALLHDAPERAWPAQLTVATWSHTARSGQAFDRFMRERHPHAARVSAGHAQGQSTSESRSTTRLALERADRFREESAGAQEGVRYLVRDGGCWLSWDEAWGVVSDESERAPLSPTFAFLLDPIDLVGVYVLAPTGEGELAGRSVVTARATPRGSPEATGSVLFRLGAGADHVELAVDAVTGALLRAEAFLDGQPFQRLEVTEIVYGPIPAATFAVAAPPGERRAPGPWAHPLRLPLHELARRAPFPVLVPAEVPAGWRLEALLVEARAQPPVAPSVHLTWTSPEGAYAVEARERAAGATLDDWPATEERDGLRVADLGEDASPRHRVAVERDGVLVELFGDDDTLLVELARSLHRAALDPPAVGMSTDMPR